MAYKSLDTSAGWGTEHSERKITPIYSLTPLKTNHCPSRVKRTQCNQHTTKCPVALLKGWCCSRGSGSNSVAERLNPQQQHSHISLSKRKPMLLTFGIASIPTIGALICELLQERVWWQRLADVHCLRLSHSGCLQLLHGGCSLMGINMAYKDHPSCPLPCVQPHDFMLPI